MNQLLVTFLTTDEKARSAEEPAESLDTGPQATVQMQLILSADDFARTENALRELVLLRNNLVHHFLEQHYLTSLDGCRAAEEAMITASGRIKQHFDGLRQWTEDLERSGLRFAEVIKSDAFHDLLIHGAMPWPITAIVIALREAAEELSLDGWAPVERAGEWVSARYPRRHPPITNATAMRVTAIQTQTERKPQDRSVRRVEKRSRQARMMRVRGPIRPAPGVCAAADAARGEKSLFRGKNQAILVSSGRQLGECRVIARRVFLVDWSDWSDIMNWKAAPCH